MKLELRNDLNVDEYNHLRNSIGWNVKDQNIAENAIKNSIIIKKAVLDDKTVGMARAISDGIYYFIVDVVVDLEYQKKGIGKKIIEAIVSEIENRTETGQASSITLISMDGKEAFYEKCGFTKVPFGYTGCGMMKKIEK